MKNTLFQFLIMVGVFGLTWFGLGQVDYISFFKLEEARKVNEGRLGKLMLENFTGPHQEIVADSVRQIVKKIIRRLCTSNRLNSDSIKIHLVEGEDVNAFALPGDHIVIYTGLISFCENPEQLTGVMAHEIAHLRKNHVMKKLIKEVGLSVLASVAGGNGAGILKKLTEKLTSSAYDRKLESEADEVATSYLLKAKIDPDHFAALLIRFSSELELLPPGTEWISSHPESKERAAKILSLKKDKKMKAKEIITTEEWGILKKVSDGQE